MSNELIKPIFIPITDLEEYTIRPRAGDGMAYLSLTTDWFWSEIFEPLQFYNLLYEQYGIIYANRSNPIVLKRHLLNLNVSKPQLLFLTKYLIEHIENRISINDKISDHLDYENIRMLHDCINMIRSINRSLFKELYENEDKEVDNPNNRYDYAREMKKLELIPEIRDKHTYLQELLSDYSFNCGPWEENKRWGGESFLWMMTKERDKYFQIIESERIFLASQIKENEPPEKPKLFTPPTVPIKMSPVREFITNEINSIDKIGWKYVFKNEKDYTLFVNNLTNFFENNPYQLPESCIIIKSGCKTRFSIILKQIYKEYSPSILKSDNKFLDILRTLHSFKDLTDNQIYKLLTG